MLLTKKKRYRENRSKYLKADVPILLDEYPEVVAPFWPLRKIPSVRLIGFEKQTAAEALREDKGDETWQAKGICCRSLEVIMRSTYLKMF